MNTVDTATAVAGYDKNDWMIGDSRSDELVEEFDEALDLAEPGEITGDST